MSEQSRTLLGVRLNFLTKGEAVDAIALLCAKPSGSAVVVTANPEILLRARNDPRLQTILNAAHCALADGVGLRLFGGVAERVTGVDTVAELLRRSVQERWRMGVIGWQFARTHAGNIIPPIRILTDDENLHAENPEFDILFVAHGCPLQEYWIEENRSKLTRVKVFMAVGGTFDMLSGRIPRAPQWMQRAGIEWLWRLSQQPQRFSRIMNATVRFPLAVLAERLSKNSHEA
ncbi:MAG: WecB/TagA/CpsF family glycosyltransferase [Parcubacteria group bacterium]|nr:WecB/TagA/CpsF family glycosyltransferase [Parcubacteria group bacterium]